MSTATPISEIKRFDHTQGPRKIGPNDGKLVQLPAVGVRFMVWGEEAGGGFSLVEHPIAPNTLVAPVHIHEREDEYSYVIEGKMGALLGDETVYAEAGDLVFKPRNQWHTFWNAGDTECRILEILSPSGFEHFFDELAELGARGASPDEIDALAARYGHGYDLSKTMPLIEEHGLEFPFPLPEDA